MERLLQVYCVGGVAVNLYDSQNELLRLVQRRQDFILFQRTTIERRGYPSWDSPASICGCLLQPHQLLRFKI